ncbi:MAG: hypothetical protein WCC06_00760 [Candidatus Aminicenantales bacterium]
MNKIKYAAALSLIVFIFSASLNAQERFQIGGWFVLGFPQGEFKKNVDQTGLGGNLFFAYRIPHSWFSIGTAFNYVVYGKESREEVLSPNIPELVVDVITTNSILTGHVLFRFQPQKGRLRPYLDALVGFHYLSTDTSIRGKDGWDDSDDEISSNNYNDIAFSSGAGGGIMFCVYQKKKKGGGRDSVSIYLDTGIHYLRGGRAEYMKKGSIRHDDTDVFYDVLTSRTDLLTAHIGVTVGF